MELISMKCPQCMGDVVPFGDGSHGRCECCDSVFALGAAASAAANVDSFDDDEEEEEVGELDLAEFFNDFASTLDADATFEFFVGTDLDSPKGQSKIAGARKYFDVEDYEDVYLVLDTTIMGSCKVGLAAAEEGLYMKDEDGDKCFLNWEDFSTCELSFEGTTLTIQGSPFFTSDAETLYDMFDELQEAL